MSIDLLNIAPNVVSRDLSGYIIFLYGAPKSGKTTTAVQSPRSLLIATEIGYKALPGVKAINVSSWSEMKAVYRELKKAEVKAEYDSIIVDTVDWAADYCQKYICNQNGIEELTEMSYGKGWTKFKDELTDLFRGLTQLGYSVWFISHSKESQVDDGNGGSTTLIRPSLSNSVRSVVEGMADLIGYAHQKKGAQMSVLTLRSPDDSVICGGRFKHIVPEIPLTYDNLVNAVREAIDKEAAEHDNKFVTDEKVEIKAEVPTYDFPALMKEFQEIVGNLITANQSNASKITNIVEQYLGKGRKVNDCTAQQSEQIDLIVHDLKELMEKGV